MAGVAGAVVGVRHGYFFLDSMMGADFTNFIVCASNVDLNPGYCASN